MENKSFEATICPICGEYEFVDDTELEKKDPNYEGYQGDQCSHCGWIYDVDQLHNPDLSNGCNKLSINDYKKLYLSKIQDDPKYNFSESEYVRTPHICPICGEYEFSDSFSYEICPNCGWEDDGIMENEPDKWSGNANDLCLNAYKKRYLKLIKENPSYNYSIDGLPER